MEGRSAVDDDHLSAGLIGLHDAMRFADLLEAKHAGRLCLEPARRHLARDFLQRHVGQWETWCAEHKTAEEREVNAAGHLQQRVEVLDRRESPQPTCEARTAAAAQQGEGIEDGAVADKIEHRIELLRFSDPLRKLRPLRFDALCAKLLEEGDALTATRGGDDPHARVNRHVERGRAEGGCGAPYDQYLSL